MRFLSLLCFCSLKASTISNNTNSNFSAMGFSSLLLSSSSRCRNNNLRFSFQSRRQRRQLMLPVVSLSLVSSSHASFPRRRRRPITFGQHHGKPITAAGALLLSSSCASSSSILRREKVSSLAPPNQISRPHSTLSLSNSIRKDDDSDFDDAEKYEPTNTENDDYDDANNDAITASNTADDDTIFALSSGFTGEQATAVAVIRISGPKAHDVLQSLLIPPSSSLSSSSSSSLLPKPRRAVLKKLYHPIKGTILDHALVILFKGPNSFTGEDLVELQCHGSRVIIQRLINDVLPNSSSTCRMAEPGEFTTRAFTNGKLDLVQVEALADILTADTNSQVEQGLQNLGGSVSKTYENWRQQLISGLAHAEAVIDFGDDEHLVSGADQDDHDGENNGNDYYEQQQQMVWGDVATKMHNLQSSMEEQLQDGRRGELIREGITVAIVGPPNAGKSSLFNLLARRDAAIVSPIAGTTRDVLQVSMDLGGIKCTLKDTAGIRSETTDILELEGMKRSQLVIQEADLIVAMVDVTNIFTGLNIVRSVLEDCSKTTNNDENKSINDDNSKILYQQQQQQQQQLLLVRNKLDLLDETTDLLDGNTQSLLFDNNDGGDQLQRMVSFKEGGTFDISCKSQEGIDSFLQAVTELIVDRIEGSNSDHKSNSNAVNEGALITRARHRHHVEAAVNALDRFSILSKEGSMAIDLAAEELRLAASELGRITGVVDVEDVLDVLFSDFCIGK